MQSDFKKYYIHGHSLKVELRSPKPSVWVRVLVPVQLLRKMNSIVEFFKASWDEVRHNVTWPKLNDLQSSTTLVLLGSLIFAAVVGLMDFLFENALNFIYQSF